MSATPLLDSASGLKPLSAFLVIGVVLALIAGRLCWLVERDAEGVALAERLALSREEEQQSPPHFAIVDSDGRPLAVSEQRLDLILSPSAMWQAHTPRHMAHEISRALGGVPSEAELLARMLPDAREGVIALRDTERGGRLLLNETAARRLAAWIASFGADAAGRPQALEGFELVAVQDGWELWWRPEEVLSAETRATHMPERPKRTLTWSRLLADGLARCLWGDAALQPGPGVDEVALARQRDRVWRALMPSIFTCAIRDLDAGLAPALTELLEREQVAYHQMRIERGLKRSYPAGYSRLLGSWGFLDREHSRREALVELGFERASLGRAEDLDRAETSLSPEQRETYRDVLGRWIAERHPLTGLERACDALLAAPEWGFLRREPATFSFLHHRPVRLDRDGPGLRAYFLEAQEASPPPRVVTTLDSLLQRSLDGELERVLTEHNPALAMGIVLDVESGDVLAIGSRSPYEVAGWAPVNHQYPPGSTFKVPIMAVALETGAVRPGTTLDVGDGVAYDLQGRWIREAELSRRHGIQTASECLAYSINAGMVQIGLRVPADVLHAYLRALHYGEAPQTGLGGEVQGSIPALPWKAKYEHASVSYGYQTAVTLWQHAAALATVVRGGEWKPLRLLAAVEQDGRSHALAAPAAERVFSQRTCEEVRDMMHAGASVGTGLHVVGPELADLYGVGTKTGTAQKVSTEVCLHLDFAHREQHALARTPCPKACSRQLKTLAPSHSGNCITLSMAAFGRRPSDGRDVFVLFVVDEPRKGSRYGSDTAGPPAWRLLQEALGLTALGEPRGVARVGDFRLGTTAAPEASEQPWAEVGR